MVSDEEELRPDAREDGSVSPPPKRRRVGSSERMETVTSMETTETVAAMTTTTAVAPTTETAVEATTELTAMVTTRPAREWPTPDTMLLQELRSKLPADRNGLVTASSVVNLLKLSSQYRKTLKNINALLHHAPFTCVFYTRPQPNARDRSSERANITLDQYFSNPRDYIVKLHLQEVATLAEVINVCKTSTRRRRVANKHLAAVYEGVLGTVNRVHDLVGTCINPRTNLPYPDDWVVAKVGSYANFYDREGSVTNEYKIYGEMLFQILMLLAGDQVTEVEREVLSRLEAKGLDFPFIDNQGRKKKELVVFPPARHGEVIQVFKEVAAEHPQTKHGTSGTSGLVNKLKLALAKAEKQAAEAEKKVAKRDRDLARKDLQHAETKRQLEEALRQLQAAGIAPAFTPILGPAAVNQDVNSNEPESDQDSSTDSTSEQPTPDTASQVPASKTRVREIEMAHPSTDKLELVPGPSQMLPNVLVALGSVCGSSDLDPAFWDDYLALERDLQQFLHAESCSVAIQSGEAMLCLWGALKSTLKPGDVVVCAANGLFGAGFADMAKALGADVRVVECDWRKSVDVDALCAEIRRSDPKLVAAAHCETPSGILNNLEGVGEAVANHTTDGLFLVDFVSSAGGAPLNVDAWKIDLGLLGPHKALSGPPALAFTTVSEKAWKRINEVKYVGYDALQPFYRAAQQELRLLPYTHNWQAISLCAVPTQAPN